MKVNQTNINDSNHFGAYKDLMALINDLDHFYNKRGQKFFDLIEDTEKKIKLMAHQFDISNQKW